MVLCHIIRKGALENIATTEETSSSKDSVLLAVPVQCCQCCWFVELLMYPLRRSNPAAPHFKPSSSKWNTEEEPSPFRECCVRPFLGVAFRMVTLSIALPPKTNKPCPSVCTLFAADTRMPRHENERDCSHSSRIQLDGTCLAMLMKSPRKHASVARCVCSQLIVLVTTITSVVVLLVVRLKSPLSSRKILRRRRAVKRQAPGWQPNYSWRQSHLVTNARCRRPVLLLPLVLD